MKHRRLELFIRQRRQRVVAGAAAGLAALALGALLLPGCDAPQGCIEPRAGTLTEYLVLSLPNPEAFSALAASCDDVSTPKAQVTWSRWDDDAGKLSHWHLSIVAGPTEASGAAKQAICYRDLVVALGGKPG